LASGIWGTKLLTVDFYAKRVRRQVSGIQMSLRFSASEEVARISSTPTEFVEGETLGSLIKRSGRLKVKLALEIAAQVAAGLAAVHKQNLVHRDIRPTNVMVSVDEESTVTAKIIELGLAKRAIDASGEAAISVPGAFAGTPEFASPEQFAGVGVDIRSDLYSLGVMIWQMLTGRTPFRGTAAEVMYQHQHAPLPLEQLDGVPQPVVVMLECKSRGHLSPAPRLGTSL
jgi:serine/threonine protein kinase